MASHLNILKIQVPAPQAVPLQAARIGEVFARFLAESGKALSKVSQAARPGEIRAELLASAAAVEHQRPDAALSLRSVAAKGWID